MKVVGLTGGIGSGKTTVASMFEARGVPVYHADAEARKLMNRSSEIRRQVTDLLGESSYGPEGLNRAYVASMVFKDIDKLMKLNAIVHPEVEKHFRSWVEDQQGPYVIQENALIFENKKEGEFDRIITVTAPLEIRISRVMQRDGASREQVLDRIRNQMDEEYKKKGASFIIENLDLEQSRKQVAEIHKQLIA